MSLSVRQLLLIISIYLGFFLYPKISIAQSQSNSDSLSYDKFIEKYYEEYLNSPFADGNDIQLRLNYRSFIKGNVRQSMPFALFDDIKGSNQYLINIHDGLNTRIVRDKKADKIFLFKRNARLGLHIEKIFFNKKIDRLDLNNKETSVYAIIEKEIKDRIYDTLSKDSTFVTTSTELDLEHFEKCYQEMLAASDKWYSKNVQKVYKNICRDEATIRYGYYVYKTFSFNSLNTHKLRLKYKNNDRDSLNIEILNSNDEVIGSSSIHIEFSSNNYKVYTKLNNSHYYLTNQILNLGVGSYQNLLIKKVNILFFDSIKTDDGSIYVISE